MFCLINTLYGKESIFGFLVDWLPPLKILPTGQRLNGERRYQLCNNHGNHGNHGRLLDSSRYTILIGSSASLIKRLMPINATPAMSIYGYLARE